MSELTGLPILPGYIRTEDALTFYDSQSSEIRDDRDRLQGVLDEHPDAALDSVPLFARGHLTGRRVGQTALRGFLMTHNADPSMLDEKPEDRQLYLF